MDAVFVWQGRVIRVQDYINQKDKKLYKFRYSKNYII